MRNSGGFVANTHLLTYRRSALAVTALRNAMWHTDTMNDKAVKGAGKKQGSATSPSKVLKKGTGVAQPLSMKPLPKAKRSVATLYKRSALVEKLLSSQNSKFTTVTPVLHGRQADAVRAAVLKQLEEDKDQLQVSFAG